MNIFVILHVASESIIHQYDDGEYNPIHEYSVERATGMLEEVQLANPMYDEFTIALEVTW